jgi:hypothetical protein
MTLNQFKTGLNLFRSGLNRFRPGLNQFKDSESFQLVAFEAVSDLKWPLECAERPRSW